MRSLKTIVILFIVLLSGKSFSQSDGQYAVIKELRSEWKIFHQNAYVPYEGQPSQTVYFTISAPVYKGDFISIQSITPMDIFVNGQLAVRKKKGVVKMSIDSLARRYSSSLTFGVFQKEGIKLLSATILSPSLATDDHDTYPRKGNSFLNFSILAVLILSVFFVFLFRSNPKLTLDYLNVTKLISVQERDDNLMATRITSSVNLLFYLYVSASCALALLLIFNYGAGQIVVANSFQIRTTAEGFYQWTRLILMIAGFLGMKLLIIYVFSLLFHLRETSALQFFNFIRMLFFIVVLIIIVAVACFVYYGYPAGPHAGLLKIGLVLLAFSVVMTFLKLLSFTPFRFFHLFSYLCASEIIPLVILLRVLLY